MKTLRTLSASTSQFIVGTAVFLTLFANLALFRNLGGTFAQAPWGYAHIASLGLVLLCALIVLLGVFCIGRATKPVLITLLVVSSITAYFMDTYNVIIDSDMLHNAAATNVAEAHDLLSWRFASYLLLLGVLPSTLVVLIKHRRTAFKSALVSRAKLLAFPLVAAIGLMLLSSGFYASFIREHKALRYYSNPATPIYALLRFTDEHIVGTNRPLQTIGNDARIPAADVERELIIMVVGETARADRFSLNGYSRDTNPELVKRKAVSLSHVSACGTSTAISVPCMFALSTRDDFDGKDALSTENALDVLKHAGVNILWRDNNSSSKGVADRVETQDFRSADTNTVCDIECRDEGMLVGLQEYVDTHPNGDILIVLHQMGSHGPAYYKRYPDAFRKFTPTCDTSQLDDCAPEAIGNAYDNTILYTDHFLAQTIDFLQRNDSRFETGLMYVSDHGESLGESGLYLHGLPYFVAPDSQTHVPVILWFGANYEEADNDSLLAIRNRHLSHDHVFHTLLGMFEIESDVYDPQKDILQLARSRTDMHE